MPAFGDLVTSPIRMVNSSGKVRVMAGHPPWIEQREDEEQLAELRAMTPEQRLEHFVQACELAIAILRERPDAAAILARREPLSPETEARWRALVAGARRA